MSSASGAMQRALVAAADGSAALVALGVVAYQFGHVPEGKMTAYVVVGEADEDESNAFGREGNTGTETLHIWVPTKKPAPAATTFGASGAKVVYAALNGILHRKPLAVAGHRHLVGRLRLVTVMPDRDPAWTHGVASYTWTTRTLPEGAP